MKIQLLGDKVLLRPLEVENESTIIIAGTEDDAPGIQYAEVVHVACGVERDSNGEYIGLDVSVGQKVMHNISAPLVVEFNGEDLHMLAFNSLLGIVSDEPEMDISAAKYANLPI